LGTTYYLENIMNREPSTFAETLARRKESGRRSQYGLLRPLIFSRVTSLGPCLTALGRCAAGTLLYNKTRRQQDG
jgi:hypothetical protein